MRFCETSLLTREDWLVIERLNPLIRSWLDIYICERDRKIRDLKVKRKRHLRQTDHDDARP